MFKKKEIQTGVSFPFMEQDRKELNINFDKMAVSIIDNEYVKITYYLDDVPLVAYTEKLYSSDMTYELSNVSGKVKVMSYN